MCDERREVLIATIALTALFEAATLAIRFGAGLTAVEFNRTAPLALQIHHMFWAVPVFAATLLLHRRHRAARLLWSLGLALIASDLAHHFLVLPLLVGHTGWHWP